MDPVEAAHQAPLKKLPTATALAVLAIMVAGLVLRLMLSVGTYNDLDLGLDDNFFYHRQAHLIADGKGFANPFRYYERELAEAAGNTERLAALPDEPTLEPTAAHVPVYSLYLAAWTVVGVDTPLGHRVVSTFPSTLAIGLLASVAYRVAGRRAALITAVLAAVYPPLWINDGFILSESMAVFMVALAMWAAYRTHRDPSITNGALLGVALALLALTRSEAVMLFVLLVVPFYFGLYRAAKLDSLRTAVGRVLVTGLVGLAVLTPWLARNLTGFAEPVMLVSGSGFVLEIANCDATYDGKFLGYWSTECGEVDATWPEGVDESTVDKAKREAGSTHIRENLGDQPKVIGARLGRAYGFYRVEQTKNFDVFFERRDPRHVDWASWSYYPMLLLAPFGVYLLRRLKSSVVPVLAVVGLALFTVAVAIGIPRYRISFDVVLVLLAGLGVEAVIRLVGARRAPGADTPVGAGAGG